MTKRRDVAITCEDLDAAAESYPHALELEGVGGSVTTSRTGAR
jgi:hypothetical protein